MEKKEYIEREKAKSNAIDWVDEWDGGHSSLRAEYIEHGIDDVPAADVVPWSWLEQYATGKRCNYASEFVYEARKEWENGTSDKANDLFLSTRKEKLGANFLVSGDEVRSHMAELTEKLRLSK